MVKTSTRLLVGNWRAQSSTRLLTLRMRALHRANTRRVSIAFNSSIMSGVSGGALLRRNPPSSSSPSEAGSSIPSTPPPPSRSRGASTLVAPPRSRSLDRPSPRRLGLRAMDCAGVLRPRPTRASFVVGRLRSFLDDCATRPGVSGPSVGAHDSTRRVTPCHDVDTRKHRNPLCV